MPDASLRGLHSLQIRRHSQLDLQLLSVEESAALVEEKAAIQAELPGLEELQTELEGLLKDLRQFDEEIQESKKQREWFNRICSALHGTLEEQALCLEELQQYLKEDPHKWAVTMQEDDDELMEATRKGWAKDFQARTEEEEEWLQLVRGVKEGTPEESERCLKLLQKWLEEQEPTPDAPERHDGLATPPLEHEAPRRMGDGLLPQLDSLGEHVAELRRRREEVDQLLQNSAEAEEAVLRGMTGMGPWQDAWRRELWEEALEEAEPLVPRPTSSHAQAGRCGTKRNKSTRRKMASHEVQRPKLAVDNLADHEIGEEKSDLHEPGRQEEGKQDTGARISRSHKVDHQDRNAQPVSDCSANPLPTDLEDMQLTAEEVAFAPHMERIFQLLEDG